MASLGLENGPDSPVTGRPRSATYTPQQPSSLHVPRHGYQSKSISSLRDINIESTEHQLPTPPESARSRTRYAPYGVSDVRLARSLSSKLSILMHLYRRVEEHPSRIAARATMDQITTDRAMNGYVYICHTTGKLELIGVFLRMGHYPHPEASFSDVYYHD